MRIQIGDIRMTQFTDEKPMYPLQNKTKKYLTPILTEYGEEFKRRFNNVLKVAIGIGDVVVENCGYKHEKHLFILINTLIGNNNQFFLDFLTWIRHQSTIYQDDYVFDNIQKSSLHMIVIKFPEKYYESFETFKIGEYSKMFDRATIDKFFDKLPTIKKVFIKDHEYKYYFVGKLNRLYSTNIDAKDYTGELELPITDKTEKFNHHLKK